MLLALQPWPAWAQAGWYYLPTLRLTEEFDDNVFSSVRRSSDFITRLTSDVKVGYRSTPFTLLLTGSADGEVFARNPELDGVNRTQSGLETEWRPVQPLTLRLGASFTKTQTPSELSPNLGLELGRQESTQLIVTPALLYRFDARTTGDAVYTYSQSDSGDVTTTTHEPRLRLSSRLTRLDAGSVLYGFRAIESGNSSSMSHLAMLGWSRHLSSTTDLALEAGPRFSDSTVDAEVSAVLTRRIDGTTNATLSYTRTSTPIVGQSGTARAQALTGRILLEPVRSLRVVAGAIVSEVSADTGDTRSQGAEVSASYRVLRWMNAFARYRFNRSSSRGTEVFHNVISIGVEAVYPTRLDD